MFVRRSALEKVEESPFLTARVENLLTAIYGTKLGEYSVKKNAKRRITPEDLQSMLSTYCDSQCDINILSTENIVF